MVLHARLPSSKKKANTNVKNNRHNNNGNTSRRVAAGLKATTLTDTPRGTSAEAAAALRAVAAGQDLPTAMGTAWTSPVQEFAAGGDGSGGGGGDCGPEGAGTGLAATHAWVMILRALSLGARSQERAVARHALQLLTKVCLCGGRRRGGCS